MTNKQKIHKRLDLIEAEIERLENNKDYEGYYERQMRMLSLKQKYVGLCTQLVR